MYALNVKKTKKKHLIKHCGLPLAYESGYMMCRSSFENTAWDSRFYIKRTHGKSCHPFYNPTAHFNP